MGRHVRFVPEGDIGGAFILLRARRRPYGFMVHQRPILHADPLVIWGMSGKESKDLRR
jgi:hypothetical protein